MTQRLFFALWPLPALQAHLYQVAERLRPAGSGRPVARDNLHLTLAFLGSVDEATRLCLERGAQAIRAGAFTLRFDQAGWFPRPRVLWLGCSVTPSPLVALVEQLRAVQLGCGQAPEQRPYVSHLTLARKVARRPAPRPFAPIEWSVDRFALIESRLGPQGAHYTPLRFWDL